MDFLFDLFSFACDVLIIYCVIKMIQALFSLKGTMEEIESRSQEIREHLTSIIHPVKSEMHNGIMYWFDAEDDTFLVQGRDDTELAAALKARWIDHIFILGDRYVLTGPDFAMVEIKDPDEVGRMLADKIINKKESNESRKAS